MGRCGHHNQTTSRGSIVEARVRHKKISRGGAGTDGGNRRDFAPADTQSGGRNENGRGRLPGTPLRRSIAAQKLKQQEAVAECQLAMMRRAPVEQNAVLIPTRSDEGESGIPNVRTVRVLNENDRILGQVRLRRFEPFERIVARVCADQAKSNRNVVHLIEVIARNRAGASVDRP